MELELNPKFLEQPKRRRYLVGISGGRDSVALLHVLLENGYRNLVVCHLNHALRGKESGKDATFARSLAKKNNLACEVKREDVNKLMRETGESMELAARNARHRFFRECALVHRCPRVLLAHHADDQAETILFNLLRGSAGLKGMRLQSNHVIHDKRIEFVRPFLLVSRDEINNYLMYHGIDYRDDLSNKQPVAARNRLRNEVIPLLNDIMGRNIRASLLRAEKISSNHELSIREILDGHKLEDPQGRLFLPKLKSLPTGIQLAAVRVHLQKHGVCDMSYSVLERCHDLINNNCIAKVNLPGGLHFRRKSQRLFIE